jgi:hypothetical protein
MNVREWITYTAVTTIQHNKDMHLIHVIRIPLNAISYTAIYSFQKIKKKIHEATATLEWDSGLARVLYTLGQSGVSTQSVVDGSCTSQWHRKEDSDCKYKRTLSLPYFFLGTRKDDAQCNLLYDLHSRSPKPASLINTKLDQHLIWQWNSAVTNHLWLAIIISRINA